MLIELADVKTFLGRLEKAGLDWKKTEIRGRTFYHLSIKDSRALETKIRQGGTSEKLYLVNGLLDPVPFNNNDDGYRDLIKLLIDEIKRRSSAKLDPVRV